MKSRPSMLLVAAAALAGEALALLAYTVLTVIDVAAGRTYTISSGVGQIVMQAIMITGLALLASGVAKSRPWTRTPSVMVQLLIGFVGIVLLQAHRWDWGVPALLLAAAGLAGLLTPASLKALARPMPPVGQARDGEDGSPSARRPRRHQGQRRKAPERPKAPERRKAPEH